MRVGHCNDPPALGQWVTDGFRFWGLLLHLPSLLAFCNFAVHTPSFHHISEQNCCQLVLSSQVPQLTSRGRRLGNLTRFCLAKHSLGILCFQTLCFCFSLEDVASQSQYSTFQSKIVASWFCLAKTFFKHFVFSNSLFLFFTGIHNPNTPHFRAKLLLAGFVWQKHSSSILCFQTLCFCFWTCCFTIPILHISEQNCC